MWRRFIWACAFILALGLWGTHCSRAADQAFLDNIKFGDTASEAAHGVGSTGSSVIETLSTEMGSLRHDYTVRTVTGKGSTVAVSVAAPAAGKLLLLEVREIHNRRPRAFGYMVLVNGSELYFRTYEEYGAGPNHYFIAVPPELAAGGERLEVTFRSEGGAAFSLEQLWVYEDFFAQVAEREQVYRRMGLIIPHQLMKTAEQRDAYEGLTCYSPIGLLAFAGYATPGVDANRGHLEKMLTLSAATEMPLLLVVNGTGWGGKPNGADGLGGYFSDARYSIVNYDRATGAYRPSWPGMWGNISTPTLRDPHLNSYLEARFTRVLGDLRDRLDLFLAQGTPSRPWLIREFAPVSGELSNFTIASARNAGLVLDPTDGLSFEERLFMHRDAAQAWQDFADSTVRVVERDSVVVEQGQVRLPEEQMLDDLYSHPDFLGTHPVNDPRWCGGQMGMVDGLWSSGEMGQGHEYRDIAMYDYVRARGKLSMINMERTILKENFGVLKNHYARGFQFVCLFNAYQDDATLVRSVDDIDDEPSLAAVHREPSVLDLNFRRDAAPGPAARIVSMMNVDAERNRLMVTDVGSSGRILYRLDNVGELFTAKLNLHLDGRVSPGERNRIDVYAGPTPDEMRLVKSLTAAELPCPDHWTPWMTSEASVDLGDTMIGLGEYFLRLDFQAAGAADAAFLLSLHVGSQWSRRSGHVGGSPFTIRESRVTQLWVQDRALAERWLSKYRELGGEDEVWRRAADMYGRGWYRAVYRLLNGEISQILPARYVVRGHGRLGRYPVEVKLPAADQAVVVKLREFGPEVIDFTLASPSDGQAVRLAFPELASGRAWAVQARGDNQYRVTAVDTDAAVSPAAFDFVVGRGEPVVKHASHLPRTLTARCTMVRGNRIVVDCQNLELMGYNDGIELTLAKNAVRSRTPDNAAFPADDKGGPGPVAMDQVEMVLDEQGVVTEIKATYGYDRGRIKAFQPPVLVGDLSNGVIELENGNRYELSYGKQGGTALDTVALNGNIMSYEVRHLAAALKPGQEVELQYCPYRGGGLPRLVSLRQPRHVLLEEDFTKTVGDEWKGKAFAVAGVEVAPHKPEPNYLYKVVMRLLRPTEHFVPGSVVYHIRHDEPLRTTAVEFTARAFEQSSRVTFYVSRDGRDWTKCGQFDSTWQNNISQNLQGLPPNFVDLTPAVEGLREFYLKMELAVNSADERFCVGRLQVVTEGQ